MNWIVGIAMNLISAAIGGIAVWCWQRWWNPVRWELKFLRDEMWLLTRRGPTASRVFMTALAGPGTPHLRSFHEIESEVTEETRDARSVLADGRSLELVRVFEGVAYTLVGQERGRYKSAAMLPSRGQLPTVLRRRDVHGPLKPVPGRPWPSHQPNAYELYGEIGYSQY